MTAYKKPYSKNVDYWCKLCGNEWHDNHIGECWMMCEGCGDYVKRKKTNYYFDETDDEGYYCNSCYEIKEDEIDNRKEEVKEPEEDITKRGMCSGHQYKFACNPYCIHATKEETEAWEKSHPHHTEEEEAKGQKYLLRSNPNVVQEK